MISYKLLKITFVTLLLVTLGEFGYYVYLWRDNIAPSPLAIVSSPAKNPESSFIKSETIDIYTSEILPSLMKLKKNNYQNFYFVNEERGYIKSLSGDDAKGQMFMEIANGQGEKIGGYTLNNDKIKAKFFLLANDSQSPITAEKLKEGGKIIIRWWESLVDQNNNFVEYVITQ